MIEAAARRANEFVRRHDSLKAVKAKKDSLDSLYAIPGYLDSIKRLTPDTAGMDSLHKAIWAHNKQIDDSLRADSLNRQRKSGIDAPVEYSAEDSMVYMGDTKLAYLFGKSHVKYQNMDLESAQAVGTNRHYLSQYFSTQGLNYNTYINGLRITHFVSLYREAVDTHQSITAQQLAHLSGFHSYRTFSDAFRRVMNQSVSTWMKA